MKNYIFIALASVFTIACNNNSAVTEEQTEQHLRDSMDAAQHIQDSLAVEAKMLADMAADTSSSVDSTLKTK
jgi:hypothetical protein